MNNSFGRNLTVTLFGESHGPAVGVLVDGITPGLPVDREEIAKMLARRRPQGLTDTARVEEDRFELLSGVFSDKTTGTPVLITIPNENVKSRDYNYGAARPSHADLTAFLKYHGFEDYRGGGHFSGRVTAGLVALGGILLPALQKQGIRIGTRIAECAGISDEGSFDDAALYALKNRVFPTVSMERGAEMTAAIEKARADGDSVGGVTETAIFGLPAGLGEPWFDSVESLLSHAVFSLGGVKGISFGAGFDLTKMRGSEANDAFVMEDGHIRTKTNHSGGLQGGITNGMPVRFRTAVKPTPSIAKTQESVDFLKGEAIPLAVTGRHDPCIVRRVCPVLDSISAIVVSDLLIGRFGTDALLNGGLWSTD